MCWADFKRIFSEITVCPKQMRTGKDAADHRMAGSRGFLTPHAKSKGTASRVAMSRRVTSSQPRLPIPAPAQQVRANGTKLDCPGRHGLVKLMGSFDVICDVCHERTTRQGALGCTRCNWDVCARCVPCASGVTPAPPAATQETTREAWTPPPPPLQPARPPPVQPLMAWMEAKAATRAKGGQGSGRTCPSGHILQPEWVVGKGNICDGCTTWIRPNTEAAACRRCDFDLCSACVASSANKGRFNCDHAVDFPAGPVVDPAAAHVFDPPPRVTSATDFHTMENGLGWRRTVY